MCQCTVCGHEIIGNSGWKTEHAMWDHITTKHPDEVRKFHEETETIEAKMEELRISLPSLYSTKQGEKVFKGGWTL